MDFAENPSATEKVDALESLLAQRAQQLQCIARHTQIIAEIDAYLEELRTEYGMAGLFEAVDVADKAMEEWL